MNLIIETDIGHDPDDLLAICYLAAAEVKIRLITIVPGDPDQIAIARLMCERIGLDIPIAASKLNREKLSSGGVHHDLLRQYGKPITENGWQPDGPGYQLVAETVNKFPDSEFFVIGPVTSIGDFIANHGATTRATMQGGFLPYNLNPYPVHKLEQFENKDWLPTFNLNGDRKAAIQFINSELKRQFVGKHVCHTVVLNQSRLSGFVPKCAASNFFVEATQLYLKKHDEKKLHDPTAAVCHLHPEIAQWVRGRVVKREAGWSTELDDAGDHIIANIDYDALWDKLWRFE